MDAATRASLEIMRSRDGGSQHTLFAAVHRTLTAAGGRALAAWLSAPLTDLTAIVARQDAWSWCLANPDATDRLRAILRTAPDMARALGRLSLNRGTPRDLAAIRHGLDAASGVAEILQAPLPEALASARSAIPIGSPLAEELAQALADPTPARLEDGGAIRTGFDGELDAHRALRDESRQVIVTLQLDFAQRFGVASLKIRHHAQLGYIIEAPSIAVEKLRQFPGTDLASGYGEWRSVHHARCCPNWISASGRRRNSAAAREHLVFDHLVRAGPGARRTASRLRRGACIPGCGTICCETGGERHLGAA